MIYKSITQNWVVILPNLPRVIYNTLEDAIKYNPELKVFKSAWEIGDNKPTNIDKLKVIKPEPKSTKEIMLDYIRDNSHKDGLEVISATIKDISLGYKLINELIAEGKIERVDVGFFINHLRIK